MTGSGYTLVGADARAQWYLDEMTGAHADRVEPVDPVDAPIRAPRTPAGRFGPAVNGSRRSVIGSKQSKFRSRRGPCLSSIWVSISSLERARERGSADAPAPNAARPKPSGRTSAPGTSGPSASATANWSSPPPTSGGSRRASTSGRPESRRPNHHGENRVSTTAPRSRAPARGRLRTDAAWRRSNACGRKSPRAGAMAERRGASRRSRRGCNRP